MSEVTAEWCAIIFATISFFLSLAIWIIIDIKNSKLIAYKNDVLRCKESCESQIEVFKNLNNDLQHKLDMERRIKNQLKVELENMYLNCELERLRKEFLDLPTKKTKQSDKKE